jgi:uncharacterized membrane protein
MPTTSPPDRRPTGGRHLGFRAAVVLVEGIAVLLHPPLLVLHALVSVGTHLALMAWRRHRRGDL